MYVDRILPAAWSFCLLTYACICLYFYVRFKHSSCMYAYIHALMRLVGAGSLDIVGRPPTEVRTVKSFNFACICLHNDFKILSVFVCF